jgi:iron complex outermembrane receptor protein
MIKTVFGRTFLLLSCAGIALGTATAASAQAVEPTTAAPDSDSLGEVVVTAERRTENLQNVPISVGVLSGADLRTFQGGGDDTLLSLSGRVPSFYAETTTGRIFPRFYIRGLGNIDFYLGASQPVSIIQDDVVLEHVVLKSNPVYDVKQVEVLRGPQGSLFGRNTTAGIVKFDTARPTQDFQAQASASYGTYNTATLDAGVGGPIVEDKLAFRISGLVQHRDNYVDNVYTGASADGTVAKKDAMGGFTDKNVRIQLLLTPTERLSMLWSAHARDYSGTSTLFLRGALTKGSNQSNASRTAVAYDEAQNNPQAYKTYGGAFHLGYDFGPFTMTSISAYETSSGYSRGDTDGGSSQFGYNPTGTDGCADCGQSQGQLRDLDQLSEEVRFASNGDTKFKWQFGGIYFDSRDTTDFYQRRFFLTAAPSVTNANTNNPNNWVRLRDINTSWGVFGQLSYEVLPGFTITAGGRESNDTKKTRLIKTADTVAGAVTYTGRTYVRLSDTQPSWDVSALYQVNPDVSLYARVAKGFRGPTIQGRSAVFNSDFTTANSETNTSWEAGFKSSLFGDTLRLNASGFYYTVRNIQLNGNDANGNGVLFNADKAVGYGLEGQADWRPVRNLTLSLGASWLHTEIKDKRVYAQVCALAGVVVCTVQDPTIKVGANTFAQINGEPLPNAPTYNFNATARYDMPVSDSAKVFISTDWNIQGYTQFVLYRTKEFSSKGNFEGGLKVGYSGGNGRYEIAAFARNITNEKNLKGVIENYMAAVYNDPRIIGVSLSGKY